MNKKKKKVAILTYHASHNYGSCLQAYALQKVISGFGFQTEIINFRTKRQKDMYSIFTKRNGLRYFLKNVTHFLFYFPLKKKWARFEDFIEKSYVLSKQEMCDIEELKKAEFDYDYYVAGSDQIWNPLPIDFDWAYFLTFVKRGKKIAYAPSFGPFFGGGDNEILVQMVSEIEKFSSVSVRESSAKKTLELYTDKKIEVVLDPTLLLRKDKWIELIDSKPIEKGSYILLYTLFSSPEVNKIAKIISKKLKMKVVVTNFTNQYDVITSYKKRFDVGPKEFLNLVYNAKLVLVTSFHGTVFSILFERPFFAIGGDNDNRISNLLKKIGLENRTIDCQNIEDKIKDIFNINFEEANRILEQEREKSRDYLLKAMEDEDEF